MVDGSSTLLAFDLLRAGLLCVLADPALLARPGQGPVRDCLGQENLPLKRVQLAGELGRLFEEYQLSRPDWILEWRKGRFGDRADRGREALQAADKVMEAPRSTSTPSTPARSSGRIWTKKAALELTGRVRKTIARLAALPADAVSGDGATCWRRPW